MEKENYERRKRARKRFSGLDLGKAVNGESLVETEARTILVQVVVGIMAAVDAIRHPIETADFRGIMDEYRVNILVTINKSFS